MATTLRRKHATLFKVNTCSIGLRFGPGRTSSLQVGNPCSGTRPPRSTANTRWLDICKQYKCKGQASRVGCPLNSMDCVLRHIYPQPQMFLGLRLEIGDQILGGKTLVCHMVQCWPPGITMIIQTCWNLFCKWSPLPKKGP